RNGLPTGARSRSPGRGPWPAPTPTAGGWWPGSTSRATAAISTRWSSTRRSARPRSRRRSPTWSVSPAENGLASQLRTIGRAGRTSHLGSGAVLEQLTDRGHRAQDPRGVEGQEDLRGLTICHPLECFQVADGNQVGSGVAGVDGAEDLLDRPGLTLGHRLLLEPLGEFGRAS